MKKQIFIALLRLSLGWVFLWAFLDKLFGLGFATTPDKAWILGQSPTTGFLKFATYGPFKPVFESLAGNVFVDYLFMFGLLGVGVALMLGIARKISTLSGTLMLFLMYLAAFPPQNNPIIDDHIVYILALQVLFQIRGGEAFGFAQQWEKTTLVKKFSFLK